MRRPRLRYFAFDLLHLDGEVLMRLPLLERKARLEPLLSGALALIHFSSHVVGNGAQVSKSGSKLGVEGIVSKQIGKPSFPATAADFKGSFTKLAGDAALLSEAADDLDDANAEILGTLRKKVASVAALIENAIRSTKQRDQGRVPSPLIERAQYPNLIHRSQVEQPCADAQYGGQGRQPFSSLDPLNYGPFELVEICTLF